jgi:hypothetical protein
MLVVSVMLVLSHMRFSFSLEEMFSTFVAEVYHLTFLTSTTPQMRNKMTDRRACAFRFWVKLAWHVPGKPTHGCPFSLQFERDCISFIY